MKTNKKTALAAIAFAVLLLVGSFAGVIAGFLLSGNLGNSVKDMVSDAMCETTEEYGITHCYHIPQVNSDAEGIADVNNEIYNTLYEIYEGGVDASRQKYGFINLGSMVYNYVQKDDTVSIVVQTQDNRSDEYDYYVFNVDTKNGTLMTKDEICAVFGKDENSFNAEVRAAVSEYSEREKAKYPESEIEKYINPIIERTLSTEYINAAAPFISKDGELSAVVSLFSSGGKDTYHHLFDIETATDKGALESCKNHISTAAQSSQGGNTIPEVSYVYVQGEEKKTERTEEKTTKPEKTTEAEETTIAATETKKPSSGSRTLTKDVLTSHSWYFAMQWECEYIFYDDGTYEWFGAGYGTGRYRIEGNILHTDDYSYEYTSLEENDRVKEDNYFMDLFAPKLKDGEKFFYCCDGTAPVWLIDATTRFTADKAYCIYRNFAIDEYEVKWDKDYESYIYSEFSMIDVDEDGTDELIVHEGTCEQDRKYHFYTYKNKEIIYLGSIGAWHSSLCDNDGYLIRYDGMSGEGIYYKVTVENGQIVENKEGTFSFPPVPDFGEELDFVPTMY